MTLPLHFTSTVHLYERNTLPVLDFITTDEGIALRLPTTADGIAAYTVADLADALSGLAGIDTGVLAGVLAARSDRPSLATDLILDLVARAQQSRADWKNVVAMEDGEPVPAGFVLDRSAVEDEDDKILDELAGLFPDQGAVSPDARLERARTRFHAARQELVDSLIAAMPSHFDFDLHEMHASFEPGVRVVGVEVQVEPEVGGDNVRISAMLIGGYPDGDVHRHTVGGAGAVGVVVLNGLAADSQSELQIEALALHDTARDYYGAGWMFRWDGTGRPPAVTIEPGKD